MDELPNANLYAPRGKAVGLLHRTVAKAWPSLQRAAGESGGGWPHFVRREFDRFLCCGCLEHGFLRLYCHHCRLDRLVPNSSKGRGFCPSCGAPRMAATASHLGDYVIPRVPTRQWVLSLPFDLRFRLAFDRALCAEVRTLFARAVIALQRRRAATLAGSPQMRCWAGGAATWTQRFGDGLRLNIHFHAVVLDGAFESREEGPPRFVAVPAPTPQDLGRVASRVICGIRRRLADFDPDSAESAYLAEDATLAACLSAASQDRMALPYPGGPRVVRPIEDSLPGASCEPDGPRCAAGGFNLHAGPRIDATDRRRLKRLCRYAGRPALSETRLGQQEDGRIIFHLKRLWSDGTRALLFTPLQLVERLALMVPPPRAHIVTYHGVLSSHSALRAQVAPDVQPEPGLPAGEACPEREPAPSPPRPTGRPLIFNELGSSDAARVLGGRAEVPPLRPSQRDHRHDLRQPSHRRHSRCLEALCRPSLGQGLLYLHFPPAPSASWAVRARRRRPHGPSGPDGRPTAGPAPSVSWAVRAERQAYRWP